VPCSAVLVKIQHDFCDPVGTGLAITDLLQLLDHAHSKDRQRGRRILLACWPASACTSPWRCTNGLASPACSGGRMLLSVRQRACTCEGMERHRHLTMRHSMPHRNPLERHPREGERGVRSRGARTSVERSRWHVLRERAILTTGRFLSRVSSRQSSVTRCFVRPLHVPCLAPPDVAVSAVRDSSPAAVGTLVCGTAVRLLEQTPES
jgi:hypothetical protein